MQSGQQPPLDPRILNELYKLTQPHNAPQAQSLTNNTVVIIHKILTIMQQQMMELLNRAQTLENNTEAAYTKTGNFVNHTHSEVKMIWDEFSALKKSLDNVQNALNNKTNQLTLETLFTRLNALENTQQTTIQKNAALEEQLKAMQAELNNLRAAQTPHVTQMTEPQRPFVPAPVFSSTSNTSSEAESESEDEVTIRRQLPAAKMAVSIAPAASKAPASQPKRNSKHSAVIVPGAKNLFYVDEDGYLVRKRKQKNALPPQKMQNSN